MGRVLLVAPSYGNSIVGAGRFVEHLKKNSSMHIHVVSESLDKKNYPNVDSITISLKGIRKKFSMLSRSKYYVNHVNRIQNNSDIVVFNNPLIAHNYLGKGHIVFIHDYNHIEINSINTKHDLLRLINRYYEKKALKNAFAVVANSAFVKNALIEFYKIEAERIHILYQGVCLNDFTFKERNEFRGPIKILYIKSNWRIGRLDLLINVLASMNNYTFQLTACGEIPPKIPQIAPNVTLIEMGPTPHSRIKELHQENDIFCTPVIREALGVANMEAMASGIPVVTTNVGGIPEVVSTEEGWICQPNDFDSLREQLLLCIENPDERLRKVRNAYRKVQKFSIENTIVGFEDIVLELSKVCN